MNTIESGEKTGLRDAETEAKLRPYRNRCVLLNVLQWMCVAVMAMSAIVLAFSDRKVWLIVLAAALGAFLLLKLRYARVKAMHDRVFLDNMGGEIEEILSAAFGPELETSLATGGREAEKTLKDRLRENIGACDLWPYWNQCSMDSYRKGVWKGKEFEAFNAKLEYERTETGLDGDATTVTDTVFEGVWIGMDTGLAVPMPVALLSRDAIPEEKMEEWFLHMGEGSFCERFRVRCVDASVAAQLLVPERTTRILKLAELTGSQVGMVYDDSKMWVALNGKLRFKDLGSGKTEHIRDLMENLSTSVEMMKRILDCISEN